MSWSSERLPSFALGGGGGGGDWDDWDPSAARSGYTSHVRALRDLDLSGMRRDPVFDLPTPRQQSIGSVGGLSPAGVAASERAEREDYLTITYDLHDPGVVELYDAVVVPQWSTPFGQMLLSVFLTLPRQSGMQVLDVACGTGYPTLELARYLGQDSDIAGIDSWEEGIQRARRRATDEWLRSVTFLTADVVESGLPERSFDIITCNIGLTSFADQAAALGALWRLLRPGGHLLLTTPLQAAMREFLDTYYLTLRDLKLEDYMRTLGRQIAARPTIEEARRSLERAGFEVGRTVTSSFALRFPSALAFLRSPIIHTTYMPDWRAIITDDTIRRLVFNEVERRLTVRAQANGGELVMTTPSLCLAAVRI